MNKLTSKDCINFVLGKNYKTSMNQKAVAKLFSLASRIFKGKFDTDIYKDDFIISGKTNENILYFKISKLRGVSYWSSIPTQFTPYKIVFKSGWVWNNQHNKDYRWIKLGNEYCKLHTRSILEIVNNFNNVGGLFRNYNSALSHAMDSSPQSWFKPSEKFRFRNLYICINEFFPGINSGDVFEKEVGYTVNCVNRTYSFSDIYKERYSTFQKYTTNLIEKIPTPPEKEACTKAEFGCSKGCVHSCIVKNVYQKNRALYLMFKEWRQKYQEHLKAQTNE